VEVLLRLCEQADVLVESFRPGVMQRLGVGYEAVARRNPKIIYCSLSGYGQTGPYQGAPGHDLNYSGWAGVSDQIGTLGQAPALSNVPVADLLGGSMTAVMGILSALFDAGRSGLGRHVDVAIADGVLAHAVIPLAALNSQGQTQPAGASKLTGLLPCYSVYATADGRYLALAALEKKFWEAFCAVVGREDLKPLHYPLDEAQSAWVRGELRRLIGAHDLAWWTRTLDGTDCCATPILKLEEALHNEQFVARGMVLPLVQVQGQGGDKQGRQFACPVKMSGFDFEVRHAAPRQGEHTDAVLLAAGYGEPEIQDLRRQGAID
jgi:crotonobetainyl-CoA:carnitine CoA-transferase CaiB-like acyl-CoA transferase